MKMKKLTMCAVIAAIMLFTGLAQAESINLGGKAINYDIPAGYVKASGPLYDAVLNVMRRAMPQGLRVQTMYVKAEDDAKFRDSNGEAGLDNYLVITTLDQLASHNITAKEFKEFKKELKENHGLIDEARDIATEKLDNVFEGQVKIGNMESLGCFGESDKALSYVVIMDQEINIEGKPMAIRQALIFTGVMVNDRLIFVNQYRIVENENEVLDFKAYSQEVIGSMNFGGSANVVNTGNSRDTTGQVDDNAKSKSPMSTVVVVIIVIVVVVVIAGVLAQKRKNSNR